jgi:hypothetical protein
MDKVRKPSNSTSLNDLKIAFSTVRQNTTIFKQLIHITCVNGFIEVQLYYMFRHVEPSSGKKNCCVLTDVEKA